MSVWASIPGEDPPNYDDGHGGDETVEHAFIAVAAITIGFAIGWALGEARR